jgi:hypothetical protein
MMNDHVYWGTGKAMQIVHTDVLETYGDYLKKEVPFSWCPEGDI